MNVDQRPCVLNIGLHPQFVTKTSASRKTARGVDAEQVERGLDAARDEATEMGLDFDTFLINDGTEIDRELREKLRERHYAFIVIGGGVRFEPGLTHLLEVLVNAVMSVSPGSVLCFNTGPDKTMAAVRRWWPHPTAVSLTGTDD